MRNRNTSLALGSLLLMLVGCGGSVSAGGQLKPEDASGKKDAKGNQVSKEAAANFDRALQSFLDHDKKQDWNEASCTEAAQSFEEAAEAQKSATGRPFPEAFYNAGLAYQRCGKDAEARTKFEAAGSADAGFHRARAQIALYDFQRTGDVDGTIAKLDQIIRDAKFQNAEALVSLAALQVERDGDQPDGDGKDDLERAQKNLQRALAVDDTYMPAFNQLAVYYLEQAKKKAGALARTRRGRRGMEVSGAARAEVNEQQLDLAALVASQAQRKNPNYAPIHNTTGLIQVELKNFNGAVKSFARARQLDPKFFEAHMNYAAVNLSFRGFAEAEKAYREALKLRPKEYEAYLGLALALRGQVNDANFDKYTAEAQKYLDEARKIDPARPETYYNEAILTHEFRAKRAGDKAIPVLEKAATQYRDFVGKAGDEPVFAAAVKRSNERVKDIEDTIKFIRDGEQAEKDAAAAEKAAKAEEAARKAQEEADKKAAAQKAEAEKKEAAAKGAPPAAPGKPGAAPAAAPGKPGAAPAAPAAAPGKPGAAPAAPAKPGAAAPAAPAKPADKKK
jgi:tetratricopeptide (TPR) repeat protein